MNEMHSEAERTLQAHRRNLAMNLLLHPASGPSWVFGPTRCLELCRCKEDPAGFPRGQSASSSVPARQCLGHSLHIPRMTTEMMSAHAVIGKVNGRLLMLAEKEATAIWFPGCLVFWLSLLQSPYYFFLKIN